jgi:hypothetical protein
VLVSVLGPVPGAFIGERYAGLSYEKAKLGTHFFSSANRPLLALFARLGRGLLRAGGNTVDLSTWSPTAQGTSPGQIGPADLERLAQFLRAVDWQILYGINLGANTPERAADEAAAAARILGASLVGFEIGNEPDLFSRNGLRAPTYDFSAYLMEWRRYRDAILGAVPGAVFSGPSSSYDVNGFTLPLAAAEGGRLGQLGQHYYRANGEDPSSTLALLFSPDSGLDAQLAMLAQTVRTSGIAGGFRYTEANSFYHGGRSGVSNSFGAALWALDFLFQTARYGCRGVNFHGGGSASGYSPIADDDGTTLQVRAEYYGMRLFREVGTGRLLNTAITTSLRSARALQLSAFAVEARDGRLSLLLLNKDAATDALVTIEADRSVRALSLLRLTAPSLGATSGILLGGSAGEPPTREVRQAGLGREHAIALPPASALLVRTQH